MACAWVWPRPIERVWGGATVFRWEGLLPGVVASFVHDDCRALGDTVKGLLDVEVFGQNLAEGCAEVGVDFTPRPE